MGNGVVIADDDLRFYDDSNGSGGISRVEARSHEIEPVVRGHAEGMGRFVRMGETSGV